jgi:hypothetical protein
VNAVSLSELGTIWALLCINVLSAFHYVLECSYFSLVALLDVCDDRHKKLSKFSFCMAWDFTYTKLCHGPGISCKSKKEQTHWGFCNQIGLGFIHTIIQYLFSIS